MYTKTLICLADSRKRPTGRCIAGKEYLAGRIGPWLRPVSSRPTKEISEQERRYESGRKASLLDIITVSFVQATPDTYQTENHVIADEPWAFIGVASRNNIISALDDYDPSFWAKAESSFHGLNDKMPIHQANQIASSLKLIAVKDLNLEVRLESQYGSDTPRRRLRAEFSLAGVSYLLPVTDPTVEEHYLPEGLGTYNIGKAALCISLTEPWQDHAYRVVASVITSLRCFPSHG